MLPEFDDDPATESLENLDAPFPSHLKVTQELPSKQGRTCYEVVHSGLERVLLLEVAAEVRDPVFQAYRERQLRLTHTGVPCVLDAGTLPDGRDWLLTTRPEGQRLDVCARSMTTSGVVALFHHVAGIVGAAHRIGSAHGNLSLDTILVLPGGVPAVHGWEQGALVDDVRQLAGVLRQILRGNLPSRLEVVVKRAEAGGYRQADGFAEALADVLQVR